MSESTTEAPPPAAAPQAETTSAPANQSTSAPSGGETTAAPSGQTSSDPSGQTTSAGGAPGITTTGAPGAPSVIATVAIVPDDGPPQDAQSLQVPVSAVLTMTWTSNNAAGVNISGVGDNQPGNGSCKIPTEDGCVTLTPIGGDGTAGAPFVITVATHPDGQSVSPHSDVNSGVAAILSFNAMSNGQVVTHGNAGDEITLTAVVSDSTDSCQINGSDASLSATSDGNKTASLTLTLATPMTGDFSCAVSCGGTPGDSGSVHIDIGPGSGIGTTTTSSGLPSGSTTQSPGTTTTLGTCTPGSTTTNNTCTPGTTTTLNMCTPSSTTSAAPGITTTLPVSTTMPGSTTTSGPPTTTSLNMCTTQDPASTTTQLPHTTTHPPSTTTQAKDGQIIFSSQQGIADAVMVDSPHFKLTPSFNAKLTFYWQGFPKDAPTMDSVPGDLQSQIDSSITANFTSPWWNIIKDGGEWKTKEYKDFWSRVTGTTGVTTGMTTADKKTLKVVGGIYDFGEIDFEAAGGKPAIALKLQGSLASIDLTKPLSSASLGIITGTATITLFSFVCNVGPYRIKIDVAGTLKAELIAATVQEVVELIADNPYIIAAAAVIAVAIVLIWVENELEVVQEAAQLPAHVAKAYMDGVNAGLAGPGSAENSIENWSDGSGFQLDGYFQSGKQQGAAFLTNNPDATDADKQAQGNIAFSGAQSWANDAVFNHYKDQNHPAELTNELHQQIYGTPWPDYKAPAPEGGAP